MKDSSLGNSPVALLLSESPKTTGSMIPTTPTYENQEQRLSNPTGRGNWNSKLASSRSIGTTSTWSKGFDGVVTTEEEGNGYGWKQSDLSVKQDTPTRSVARLPPIRRKSDSTASQLGQDSGSQRTSNTRTPFTVATDGTYSAEERTKASSGLGNSPRVTLLYKTDSANYQSKSCNDALAAAVGQTPDCHSNDTVPTNSDEENCKKDDMFWGSKATLDKPSSSEVRRIKQRDAKGLPTPHSSPAPSSIQGQSTAESCCSVYTNATIKNRSKGISQDPVKPTDSNIEHEVDRVGLEDVYIRPREVDGAKNRRSAFVSSGFHADSVLESDLEPVALAEGVHVRQVWNDKALEELDNLIDSDWELHSTAGSVNTDTLFDTLGKEDTANVLRPHPRRRKAKKFTDKAPTKKRVEAREDSTTQGGKLEKLGKKAKSDIKEAVVAPMSNIVPLASRLGHIAKTPSLSSSRNQSMSPEKVMVASALESHRSSSASIPKDTSITEAKLQSSNTTHSTNKTQKERMDPEGQQKTEKAPKSENLSLRSKNLKKTKLIQEQLAKQKEDKNKQKKAPASQVADEIQPCDVHPVALSEATTKERNLVDLTNLRHEAKGNAASSKDRNNINFELDSGLPIEGVSRSLSTVRPRSSQHDGYVHVNENAGLKKRELPIQEWSKDGVDVFGRKVLFWAVVFWAILWSFIKYCTFRKVILAALTKTQKKTEMRSLQQCDPLTPLRNIGTTSWDAFPVDLDRGWCPTMLETVFGLNKCPVMIPNSRIELPSPADTTSGSSITFSGVLTWGLVAVVGMVLLCLYWFKSAPVQDQRPDRSRQRTGRSRSRSTSRRRRPSQHVTFQSPISTPLVSNIVKTTLTTASSAASRVQEMLKKGATCWRQHGSGEQSYRAESVETDVLLASRHSPSPAPRLHQVWSQDRLFTKSPSPAPSLSSKSSTV